MNNKSFKFFAALPWIIIVLAFGIGFSNNTPETWKYGAALIGIPLAMLTSIVVGIVGISRFRFTLATVAALLPALIGLLFFLYSISH